MLYYLLMHCRSVSRIIERSVSYYVEKGLGGRYCWEDGTCSRIPTQCTINQDSRKQTQCELQPQFEGYNAYWPNVSRLAGIMKSPINFQLDWVLAAKLVQQKSYLASKSVDVLPCECGNTPCPLPYCYPSLTEGDDPMVTEAHEAQRTLDFSNFVNKQFLA